MAFMSWADWAILGNEAMNGRDAQEARYDLIELSSDAAEEGDHETCIVGHLLAWPLVNAQE